jgi:hypothetical protein
MKNIGKMLTGPRLTFFLLEFQFSLRFFLFLLLKKANHLKMTPTTNMFLEIIKINFGKQIAKFRKSLYK